MDFKEKKLLGVIIFSMIIVIVIGSITFIVTNNTKDSESNKILNSN